MMIGQPPPDTDDLDAARTALTIQQSPEVKSADQKKTMIVTLPLPRGTIDKNASFDPNRTVFLKLPPELRNKVYRQVFKKADPINVKTRHGFPHGAAFLRVNRLVNEEACNILYGENSFVFIPTTYGMGNYYEKDWSEIGYSHIRQFLTDIGPANISLIADITLTFQDGTRSGNPGKTMDERRFENNDDLYWILKQLGRHGNLEELNLDSDGHRNLRLGKKEAAFIHALAAIQTNSLRFGREYIYRSPPSFVGQSYRSPSRQTIDGTLKEHLQHLMVRPKPLKAPKASDTATSQ